MRAALNCAHVNGQAREQATFTNELLSEGNMCTHTHTFAYYSKKASDNRMFETLSALGYFTTLRIWRHLAKFNPVASNGDKTRC